MKRPNKSRPFFIIIISLLIFIILTAAGAALFFYFFPKDKLINIITAEVEKSLKRKIQVEDIDYSLGGVVLKGVVIFDGLSADDPKLLSADEADIRFSLLSLMDKQINISNVTIEALKVNITHDGEKSNFSRFFEDLKSDKKSSTTAKIDYIKLKNADISLKQLPDKLAPLNGDYKFSGRIDIISKDLYSITDAKAVLPENRGVIYPDLKIKILHPGFEITGDSRLNSFSILWTYKWKEKDTLPFKSFSGDVKNIKITKSLVKCEVSGSSGLKDSKNLSVNGSCRVDIPSRTINITRTKGVIGNSSISFDEMTFINGGLNKLIIPSMDTSFSDLNSVAGFLPKELFGTVSGNLSIISGNYNGTLNLTEAGFNKKDGIISRINGAFNVSGNRFKKENLEVLIYNQPCTLSVAATDNTFSKFYLTLNSKNFEYKFIEKKSSSGLKMNLPVEITGRMDIDNLKIGKIVMSNVMADYSMSGPNLNFNRLYSKFSGGEIKGKANISFVKYYPDIYLSIAFNGIKIQNISSLSESFKDRAFGIAEGRADLDFSIDKNSDIGKSMKGKVEFHINKGKFVDTGIQNGLGIWLSELKYKLKDLEFNKIYGNFNIIGLNFYINSFIFQAQDIRLDLNGYFTRSLQGDIKLNLEFTRNFIEDLPDPLTFISSIQLNKYKKGSWYVIPFQAAGNDITNSKNLKRLK